MRGVTWPSPSGPWPLHWRDATVRPATPGRSATSACPFDLLKKFAAISGVAVVR